MTEKNAAQWVLVGVLIGMLTTQFVSPNYTMVGALLGGAIGYMWGKTLL